MRRVSGGVAALLLTLSLPAVAQDASGTVPLSPAKTAPALAVVLPQSNDAPVLRTGTEIPLRLIEELTTRNKALRVADRFRLETTEPVLVDGVNVIPVGSRAIGEITEVRNKGMWGKSGRFVARLLYVTVNGRRIRLSGDFDDKGTAGGAGAVAVSALVFLPAGFFMTGTSAELPIGTQIKGFIDEDVPLQLQAQPAAATANVQAVHAIAVAPQTLPKSAEVLPKAPVGNARVRCVTCR